MKIKTKKMIIAQKDSKKITMISKRWFNVDCSTVTDYYGLNDDNLVAALEAGNDRICILMIYSYFK